MEQTYDLLATILETWQTTANDKYSSSSQQAINALFKAFNRMVLLRISDLDATTASSSQIVDFLNYCVHYQKLLLSSANTDIDFLRCFCYHLYTFMRIRDPIVQATTMNVSIELHVAAFFRLYTQVTTHPNHRSYGNF
jgi:hypothetical protein